MYVQRYPEEVADRAWDNVGLLLGNMDANGQTILGLQVTPDEKTVLLTNDLSPAVAQEAVNKKASVVVSYRTSICDLYPAQSRYSLADSRLQTLSFSGASSPSTSQIPNSASSCSLLRKTLLCTVLTQLLMQSPAV